MRGSAVTLLVLALTTTGCESSGTHETSSHTDDDGSNKTKSKRETRCSRDAKKAISLANEGDQVVQLDPNNAIAKYEQATLLAPTNHRIYYKLAKAYEKKEEWDKVAATMARATDIAPKFANYWHLRGRALTQQARAGAIGYDLTVPLFEKCVDADPNYSECHAGLGQALAATMKTQEALAALTSAVQTDPKRIDNYVHLAVTYIEADRLDEAKQVLEQAKAFAQAGDSALGECHALLGDIAMTRRDATRAAVEYEAAKAAQPSKAAHMFRLALAYRAAGKKAEAMMLLKGFTSRSCKSAGKSKRKCEVAMAALDLLKG